MSGQRARFIAEVVRVRRVELRYGAAEPDALSGAEADRVRFQIAENGTEFGPRDLLRRHLADLGKTLVAAMPNEAYGLAAQSGSIIIDFRVSPRLPGTINHPTKGKVTGISAQYDIQLTRAAKV
jgi:hypothetical protein